MPDLSEHGPWVTERLLKFYPFLTQQRLFGWLNSILYSNDFLILYQPHAVGLAKIVTGYMLSPIPIIQEEFVFVENKEDADQVDAAVAFYADFARWSKALGSDILLLAPERSDVPTDKIKGIGRVFQRQQTFVNLKG